MNKFFGLALVSTIVIYGFAVFYTKDGGVVSAVSVEQADKACHMPVNEKQMLSIQSTASQEQDPNPPQPDDTPTHRRSPGDGCSSVNPNARPGSLNGVKPNTVGCSCIKKCANGHTQEDLTKDEQGRYICKNACYKDRCFCPDPCKS